MYVFCIYIYLKDKSFSSPCLFCVKERKTTKVILCCKETCMEEQSFGPFSSLCLCCVKWQWGWMLTSPCYVHMYICTFSATKPKHSEGRGILLWEWKWRKLRDENGSDVMRCDDIISICKWSGSIFDSGKMFHCSEVNRIPHTIYVYIYMYSGLW
jgi:hypothetical protein